MRLEGPVSRLMHMTYWECECLYYVIRGPIQNRYETELPLRPNCSCWADAQEGTVTRAALPSALGSPGSLVLFIRYLGFLKN